MVLNLYIYFLLLVGPFVVLFFFKAWTLFTAKPEKVFIVPYKVYSRYSRQDYLDLIRRGDFLGQYDETCIIHGAFFPIVIEEVDSSDNQNWANWLKNNLKKK
jgi:hypothetical protein